MTVPKAIVMMVSINAALRPLVSPNRPMMMPPSGRIRKPTPKTAKDESSAAAGLPGGKKLRAITLAKKT